MAKLILTCNAGSNSLKCALCEVDGKTFCYNFTADNIHGQTTATITDKNGNIEVENTPIESGYENALFFFYGWFEENIENYELSGVGHRIVHGGPEFNGPVIINDSTRQKLEELVSFAPLHQPYNLKLVDILKDKLPDLPQIACFDTAFHQDRPFIAKEFALPRKLTEEENLYRYGFHGLSYDYISNTLPDYVDDTPDKNIIIVHMGSGVSACAVKNNKCVETTMGFSALEGFMMATRCGRLDPGVILHLLQQKNMSPQDIEDILYKKSGLLGVSKISADMRDLQDNPNPKAQQAVDLFCYMAAREIGSLIPTLGGLDILVFTGAMGKNSAIIRQQICSYFSWLHMKLSDADNEKNHDVISAANSEIKIFALQTDEEAIIAQHTAALLNQKIN